jgi:DNA-binding transcriptional ArsR family regulator
MKRGCAFRVVRWVGLLLLLPGVLLGVHAQSPLDIMAPLEAMEVRAVDAVAPGLTHEQTARDRMRIEADAGRVWVHRWETIGGVTLPESVDETPVVAGSVFTIDDRSVLHVAPHAATLHGVLDAQAVIDRPSVGAAHLEIVLRGGWELRGGWIASVEGGNVTMDSPGWDRETYRSGLWEEPVLDAGPASPPDLPRKTVRQVVRLEITDGMFGWIDAGPEADDAPAREAWLSAQRATLSLTGPLRYRTAANAPWSEAASGGTAVLVQPHPDAADRLLVSGLPAAPAPSVSGGPGPLVAALLVGGSALPFAVSRSLRARVGGTAALLLGLFSRHDREPHAEESRRRILKLVAGSPGLSITELAHLTALPRGTIRHHVRRMERERKVRTIREGRHRRVVTTGGRAWDTDSVALLGNRALRNVAYAIAGHPGFAQKEIAALLGLAPSTVTWHVKRLRDAGLIRQERSVQGTACYPTEKMLDIIGSHLPPVPAAPTGPRPRTAASLSGSSSTP